MQYSSIIILLIILAGMMLFSSRNQKRQKQERENMKNNLVKGAVVETIGGLIAEVDEVDKENQRIVLDADGVYLTFAERSIFKVISSPAQNAATDNTAAVEQEESKQADTTDEAETAIEEG
ncbi:preprotein translocase subunit YajC [Streptococcus dentasini]